MKSKNLLIIGLIIFISIVLRILFLDKPSGLWYDELVMYNQASFSSVMGVIKNVLKTDVHLPLYQVLLHYWGILGGYSDFWLRLFSVICGVLTVFIAYFIGDKKQGLICMFLFAINSFLIYYSQEVRMYGLLALFSTLNLISLIKIEKQDKGYIFWILSSLGMILTYTTSIIYVFIEVVAYLVYKRSRKFIVSAFTLAILNIPLVMYLILNYKKYSTFITGFYTDYSSLFVAIQNFFTPKLIGLNNNPVHYVQSFLDNINFYSVGFVVIPIAIAIYFIVRALIRDKFNWVFFSAAIAFVLVQVLAFQFSNFNILSRYLILILPNFLVLIAIGCDFKKMSTILISVFILINLSYLAYSSNAAYRLNRIGFKPLVSIINNEANEGDIVVVWNRHEILNKYIKKKVKAVSVLQDFSYNSEKILENQDKLNKMSLEGRKEFLRTYFLNPAYPSNTMRNFSIMYNTMKQGDKVLITVFPYLDDFDRKIFEKSIADENLYKDMTYNNLLTIHSLLNFKQLCVDNLKYEKTIKTNEFVVHIYKK